MFDYANRQKNYKADRRSAAELSLNRSRGAPLQFRRAITVALADVPRIPGPRNSTKQRPGRDMLEFCRDREADVLRFTTDTSVWPTNNISESGLRPNKTQQKISGRLTSDDTTQDRLDIRSYIDTARKHSQDVLTVLHTLFTGSPWAPPAPGQA